MARQSVDLMDFVWLGLENALQKEANRTSSLAHAAGQALAHEAPHAAEGAAHSLPRDAAAMGHSATQGPSQAAGRPGVWRGAVLPATKAVGRSGMGAVGGHFIDQMVHDDNALQWSEENMPNWFAEGHRQADKWVPNHTFAAVGGVTGLAGPHKLPAWMTHAGSKEVVGEGGQLVRQNRFHPLGTPARAFDRVSPYAHVTVGALSYPASYTLGAVGKADRALHDIGQAAEGDYAPEGTATNRLQRAGWQGVLSRLEQAVADPNHPAHAVAMERLAQLRAQSNVSSPQKPTRPEPMGPPAPGQSGGTGDPTKSLGQTVAGAPNWAKGLGVAGGAGLAAYLAHRVSGDEEDPETGKKRKRMPWLAPLVGAGALAGGAYWLKGDRPWESLLKPEFWKQGSGGDPHALPLVTAGRRMKFAAAPPVPPVVPQPPVPQPPTPQPPVPAPQTPAPEQLPPPSVEKPQLAYNEATRPAYFNSLYGQDAPVGQPRSHVYAAGAMSQRLNAWHGQQLRREQYAQANPNPQPSQGAQNPAPWLNPGEEDMSGWFGGMSDDDKAHAYGLLREHAPGSVENFRNAANFKPAEIEEQDVGGDFYRPEGSNVATHMSASGGKGPSHVVLPQGATERLAQRALQQNPEANDPNHQMQNIRNQLLQQGHGAEGLWETVQKVWGSLSPGMKVLVGAGLGLGAVGLLGTLSGSESFGGGTGVLMGLGGLAAAAYGGGLFDPNSSLRRAFSGGLQNGQNSLPNVPNALTPLDPKQLSAGGFGAQAVEQMAGRAAQGDEAAVHWFARHDPDSQEAVMGMFHGNPRMQGLLNEMYQKVVPQYRQWHSNATSQAQQFYGRYDDAGGPPPGGQVMGQNQPAGQPPLQPAPGDQVADANSLLKDPYFSRFVSNSGGKLDVSIANLQSLKPLLETERGRQDFYSNLARLSAPLRTELKNAALSTLTPYANFSADAREAIKTLQDGFNDFETRMAGPGGAGQQPNPNQGGTQPAQIDQAVDVFHNAPTSQFVQYQEMFRGAPKADQAAIVSRLEQSAHEEPGRALQGSQAKVFQQRREQTYARAQALRDIMVDDSMRAVMDPRRGPQAQADFLRTADVRSLALMGQRMRTMLGDLELRDSYGVTDPANAERFATQLAAETERRLATAPLDGTTGRAFIDHVTDPTLNDEQRRAFMAKLPPQRQQEFRTYLKKIDAQVEQDNGLLGGKDAVDRLAAGDPATRAAATRQLVWAFGGPEGSAPHKDFATVDKLVPALAKLDPNNLGPEFMTVMNKDGQPEQVRSPAYVAIKKLRTALQLHTNLAHYNVSDGAAVSRVLRSDADMVRLAQAINGNPAERAAGVGLLDDARDRLMTQALTPEARAALAKQRKVAPTLSPFDTKTYAVPARAMLYGQYGSGNPTQNGTYADSGIYGLIPPAAKPKLQSPQGGSLNRYQPGRYQLSGNQR
jgi:hypothetical protein